MPKSLKIAVIISGAILLTACSSTKSKSGAPGAEQMGEVQTTGMSVGGGFGDEGPGGAFDRANRLKAPYNQRYHFEFNKYDVLPEDIESINVQGNYLAALSICKSQG